MSKILYVRLLAQGGGVIVDPTTSEQPRGGTWLGCLVMVKGLVVLTKAVMIEVRGGKCCPDDVSGLEWAYRDWETDRKSTRLNSSHRSLSRMPSSA